jgi:putative ABC transport system permease protein
MISSLHRFFKWRRLPLAWLMLKRYPLRLLTSLIALSIAAMLVLMQFAIQNALYNTSAALISSLDADAFMLSQQSSSIMGLAPFPQERLSLVYGGLNVEDVYPFTFRYVEWRLPGQSIGRYPLGIGVPPYGHPFLDPQLSKQLPELALDGAVLFDELSPTSFGPVKQTLQGGSDFILSSGRRRLRVVGLFRLGPTFAYEATAIMSIATFNDLFPIEQGKISLGLIQLKSGVNAGEWVANVSKLMPKDVYIITKEEFVRAEQRVWSDEKPIGFIFNSGAVMGLAIGAMMVYQILSSDVSYNISTYATMLSIGYRRSQLELILALKAFIISSISYPIALAVSLLVCRLITGATSMQIALSPAISISTYLMILLVCISASLFAMLKLRDADPSELFQ